MGRGQYDRAAAKAKRELPGSVTLDDQYRHPVRSQAETEAMLTHMMDRHLPPAQDGPRDYPPIAEHVPHQFVRPGYPYLNAPDNLLELQAKLDAANALLDRYKELVKRNGLWLDE